MHEAFIVKGNHLYNSLFFSVAVGQIHPLDLVMFFNFHIGKLAIPKQAVYSFAQQRFSSENMRQMIPCHIGHKDSGDAVKLGLLFIFANTAQGPANNSDGLCDNRNGRRNEIRAMCNAHSVPFAQGLFLLSAFPARRNTLPHPLLS